MHSRRSDRVVERGRQCSSSSRKKGRAKILVGAQQGFIPNKTEEAEDYVMDLLEGALGYQCGFIPAAPRRRGLGFRVLVILGFRFLGTMLWVVWLLEVQASGHC